MNTRSASGLHLSRRATALAALVLAALGTSAFTTAARANFTLNTGKITLTAGATTGNPPTGSWVSLPSDDPGGYFTNPNSTWTGTPDKLFTRIQPGTTGLTLGGTQTAGGIIGSTTDTFAGLPWTLISTSDPTLTFSGSSTDSGTRVLTGGDLSGLRVTYAGSLYNVATGFGAGAHRIHSLTGSITGSTDSPTNRITLTWTTDLTEPGFSTFRAHFQLAGSWEAPPPPPPVTTVRLDPGDMLPTDPMTVVNTENHLFTFVSDEKHFECPNTRFDLDLPVASGSPAIIGSLTSFTPVSCDSTEDLPVGSCHLHNLPIADVIADRDTGGEVIFTDMVLSCQLKAVALETFCYYTAEKATGIYDNATSALAFTNVTVIRVAPTTDAAPAETCGTHGTWSVAFTHIVDNATKKTLTIKTGT